MDFPLLRPEQYGTSAVAREHATFSELLNAFYERRDLIDRMRIREQDLPRHLIMIFDRLSRETNAQRGGLAQCAEQEHPRVCGDLLNANLHQIESGLSSVELENFCEKSLPKPRIRLGPRLAPSQSAQKYYKDYHKVHTAEEKLTEQIVRAQQELSYLDMVLGELNRTETERDLIEIRQELQEQGYLKAPGGSKRCPAATVVPMEFTVSDGFRVLMGRNNKQNDRLTLKLANNNDIWFYTKNIPGSCIILVTDGRTPTESALLDATRLVVAHSKGKSSSQVSVDYTRVRHVHKPAGAKPGMVIYENYRTMYVAPEE